MHFGLNLINAWSADFFLQATTEAEKIGWEGLFLWDHVTFEFDVGLHDQWVSLGVIAARTKKLRLRKLVTPLARRRPHITAKATLTPDHLSKVARAGRISWMKREFSTPKNLENMVRVSHVYMEQTAL